MGITMVRAFVSFRPQAIDRRRPRPLRSRDQAGGARARRHRQRHRRRRRRSPHRTHPRRVRHPRHASRHCASSSSPRDCCGAATASAIPSSSSAATSSASSPRPGPRARGRRRRRASLRRDPFCPVPQPVDQRVMRCRSGVAASRQLTRIALHAGAPRDARSAETVLGARDRPLSAHHGAGLSARRSARARRLQPLLPHAARDPELSCSPAAWTTRSSYLESLRFKPRTSTSWRDSAGFRDDFLRWLEIVPLPRLGVGDARRNTGLPRRAADRDRSLASRGATGRDHGDEPGPPPERARLEGGARGDGGSRALGHRLRHASHARARRRGEGGAGLLHRRRRRHQQRRGRRSLRRAGHRHHGAQLRAGARRRGDARSARWPRSIPRPCSWSTPTTRSPACARDRARARARLRLPRARHPPRLGRSRASSRAAPARCSTTRASSSVRIIASGGLDENEIASLVARGAPIDAFGVGTRMGASSRRADPRPGLQAHRVRRPRPAQALARETRAARAKAGLSPRAGSGGRSARGATGDVVAAAGETIERAPAARPGHGGGRADAGRPCLARARRGSRARDEIARLPATHPWRWRRPNPATRSRSANGLLALEAEALARTVTAPKTPAAESP